MCEFNDSRRKELETEFPGITLYKDYKELLKDTAIEALSIVLPDNLHREAVELAVQAGKHILLEKPLAKELEDGESPYMKLQRIMIKYLQQASCFASIRALP